MKGVARGCPVTNRSVGALGVIATVTAVVLLTAVPVAGQTQTTVAKTADWTPPRTPWGEPDLQGIWDSRTITPLERPSELAGQEFLTDEQVAELEQQAIQTPDGRPPAHPRRGIPTVHAPFWLDYGTKVVGSKRTSLIVDPPDGKIPPLTPEAQKRADARAEASREHPADSWEDRSLWERCITRGLPNGMLPDGYNNNVHLLQTPGYVVIFNEMIHNARIVPLDGRPHLPKNIRQWTGDSRGHWEGNTLVVETTNFSDKADFRGSGETLHLVERFTRGDADTIRYEFTVDDPTTWTRPWTIVLPMTKSQGPMYEYACHEGNHDVANILRIHRAEEKAAEAATKEGSAAPIPRPPQRSPR